MSKEQWTRICPVGLVSSHKSRVLFCSCLGRLRLGRIGSSDWCWLIGLGWWLSAFGSSCLLVGLSAVVVDFALGAWTLRLGYPLLRFGSDAKRFVCAAPLPGAPISGWRLARIRGISYKRCLVFRSFIFVSCYNIPIHENFCWDLYNDNLFDHRVQDTKGGS